MCGGAEVRSLILLHSEHCTSLGPEQLMKAKTQQYSWKSIRFQIQTDGRTDRKAETPPFIVRLFMAPKALSSARVIGVCLFECKCTGEYAALIHNLNGTV